MDEFITLKTLQDIEGELLKIEDEHKFELTFAENVKLKKLLNEIGWITDLGFSLSIEYSKFANEQDTAKYVQSNASCPLNIDLNEHIRFIEDVKKRIETSL